MRLFEKPITSKGEARWACGEFFEQAISEVTGGVRLRTDATCDICPDIQFNTVTFGECKAVGRNGAVIFYCHRVEKDQRFMESTGNQIVYWFWQHTYPVLGAETFEELNRGLAANTKRLLIVDAELLARGTRLKEPRIVNSGFTVDGRNTGYGKNGSGSGWTIRLSFFRDNCRQLACPIKPTAYGVQFPPIPVYTSKPEYTLLAFPNKTQRGLEFGPS